MVINVDIKQCDGTMHRVLQCIESEVPILMLSRVEELSFNEEILSLKGKKFVVVDMIEEGWDVPIYKSVILGRNKAAFMKNEGWDRLNDFLSQNEPLLYFKRELLLSDETEIIRPIEYPNFQKEFPLESKEQFDKRPLSTCFYWGRSHEARLILQGEVWKNAARKGYAVCDNVYYLNAFLAEEQNPNKWVTFNIPHYARIDISELMKINAMSKLSVSLPGCGIKCFRTTGESIVNSVMIMPEDNLAYSYPFVNNFNCITFPKPSVDGISIEWHVCEAIEEALLNPNLYDIYKEGLEAAKFYQVDRYIPYIENKINSL